MLDRLCEGGENRPADFFIKRERVLGVDADQLLIGGQHPLFSGGTPRRVAHHHRVVDAIAGQHFSDDFAVGVITEHAVGQGVSAEGHQVAHHIAGAAETAALAFGVEHQNRSLRRNPPGAAEGVGVEHQVSDHRNAAFGKVENGFFQIFRTHFPSFPGSFAAAAIDLMYFVESSVSGRLTGFPA